MTPSTRNPPFPPGLLLFYRLPDDLLHLILLHPSLRSTDLWRLRHAATPSLHSLQVAIDDALQARISTNPHAQYLLPHRHPCETDHSLLRFIERLDGAVPPVAGTEIWSCGRNDFGQGARSGTSDVNMLLPTLRIASPQNDFVTPPPPVIKVAAGVFHSACITALGTLHMTGANRRGQLGVGDTSIRRAWTPVLGFDTARIAQVACGAAHTIALSGDGDVFGTGANEYGQLGLSNVKQVESFAKLSPTDVIMVAAGTAHSVVLTENGDVYATGDNCNGQLAHQSDTTCNEFRPVSCYGRKVIRIACGATTTMLLTADNMVLVTGKRRASVSVIGGLGNSRVTHLGVGERFAIASTDQHEIAVSVHRKRFCVTNEVRHIDAMGVSAGASHGAIVGGDGHAYAFGGNGYGQVAAGEMGLAFEGSEDAQIIRPHRVELSRVAMPAEYKALQVAAGAFHTLYVLQRDW